MEFARNSYALRTMLHTLAASYAMAGLAQTRNRTVVTDKKGPSRLGIFRIGRRLRDVTLIDTLIIMQEHTRNVDAIGTRHAVFTVIAWHCGILRDESGRVMKELKLAVGQRFQRTERAEIILKMFLIGHAAKHCEHLGICAAEPKCPRRHTLLRLRLLQARHYVVGKIRKASAEERLHYHNRDLSLCKLIIEINRVGVARIHIL